MSVISSYENGIELIPRRAMSEWAFHVDFTTFPNSVNAFKPSLPLLVDAFQQEQTNILGNTGRPGHRLLVAHALHAFSITRIDRSREVSKASKDKFTTLTLIKVTFRCNSSNTTSHFYCVAHISKTLTSRIAEYTKIWDGVRMELQGSKSTTTSRWDSEGLRRAMTKYDKDVGGLKAAIPSIFFY